MRAKQAHQVRRMVVLAQYDFATSREWAKTTEGRRELLLRLQEAQLASLDLWDGARYLVALSRLQAAEDRRLLAAAKAVQPPFDPWSYTPRPCNIVGDNL